MPQQTQAPPLPNPVCPTCQARSAVGDRVCGTCEGTGFAEVTVTVYDASGEARKVKDWGS